MKTEHESMLARLDEAQSGDEEAKREVAVYCFNRYRGRIAKFDSADPSDSFEDVQQVFFEALITGIDKDKGIGDRLYYVGQYGVWAVRSYVRAMARKMEERDRFFNETEDGEPDPIEQIPSLDLDFTEVVVHQEEVKERVALLKANLTPTAHRLVDLILSDDEIDVTQKGWQAEAADKLDISPQRVSQVLGKLRDV